MTSTPRTRKHRERLKSGVMIAQLEIPRTLADTMTAMGLIPETMDSHVSGPIVMQQRGQALLEFIRRLRSK